MSLVYITHHNENIFDVDKKHDYQLVKHHERYQSKFKPKVREEREGRQIINLENNKKLLTSSAKLYRRTMGYAEVPLSKPSDFLRKNMGVKWQRAREHQCPPKREMPLVPHFPHPTHPKVEPVKEVKRDKEELLCPRTRYFRGHKHRANFIARNVELMKKSVARRPPPRYVDTPTGESHNLMNSGLIPQHVCTKKFGKVPPYIGSHKKLLKSLNEKCQDAKMTDAEMCRKYLDHMPGVRKLTEDERTEILHGLRVNFEALFKIYQSLSVCTDTVAKKLRKGRMERELRQLEQDIYLMEHNPEIFVSSY